MQSGRTVCWGASTMGHIYLQDHGDDVSAFVDSDTRKWGSCFQGIPVYSPQRLGELQPGKIVITSTHHEAIARELKNMGYSNYEIFHPADREKWRKALTGIFRMSLEILICQCAGLVARLPGTRPVEFLHVISESRFTLRVRELAAADPDHEHRFLIWQSDRVNIGKYACEEDIRIPVSPGRAMPFSVAGLWRLATNLIRSRRIILHSFPPFLAPPFIALPSLARRTVWIGWGGGDLYYRTRRRNLRLKLWDRCKARMRWIGAVIPGDYHYARERYQVTGDMLNMFYPNPIANELLIPREDAASVMVGHSAVRHMRHLEVLWMLKERKIEGSIWCPLSYGDDRYADMVEKEGRNLFGERFTAERKYHSPEAYAGLLARVQIAVFHSMAQSALSTIYALCFLGAHVYLPYSNRAVKEFLVDLHGLHIGDSELLMSGQAPVPLSRPEREANRGRALVFFDGQRIQRQWLTAFREVAEG